MLALNLCHLTFINHVELRKYIYVRKLHFLLCQRNKYTKQKDDKYIYEFLIVPKNVN